MHKSQNTEKFTSVKTWFKFIAWSIFLFPLLVPASVVAQVVINEVLPDPADSDEENEWVELYNNGNEEINISGFILKDAANHELTIPEGSIIQSKNWFVIYRNGNASFSLNNSGEETVILYDLTNNLLDSFSYSGSATDKSWGRIPDGGSISPTKLVPTSAGANKAPDPIPSPSPSPEPTPKSEPSPSASGTVIVSATPNVYPKVTPKPLIKISPSPLADASVEILSEKSEMSPVATVMGESTKSASIKFPLGILFVTTGIILSGSAGYLAYKQSLIQKRL